MTDAFTTAARVEAEEYAWDRNAGTTHEDSLDRDAFASGYEYGAIWARDHLAAQEPTDAEVEALVDSLNWAIRGTTDGDLIDQDSDIPAGEVLRLIHEGARAALTAAKEARHG